MEPVHLLDRVLEGQAARHARPCPIAWTASEALSTAQSVALASDRIRLACRSPASRAVRC